jgi:hypothetical protein
MRRLQPPKNMRVGYRKIIKIAVRNGTQSWLLRCDCGEENWGSARQVLAGKTKRCRECYRKSLRTRPPKNLRIGCRTIIKMEMRKGRRFWLLRCDCGEKTWAHARRLIKKSCFKCYTQRRQERINVLVGEQFGDRIITKTRIKKGSQWCLAKCNCGNEVWMPTAQIRCYGRARCRSCRSVLISNKQYYPKLPDAELQRILDLKLRWKKFRKGMR